jgi:hypothetical protein
MNSEYEETGNKARPEDGSNLGEDKETSSSSTDEGYESSAEPNDDFYDDQYDYYYEDDQYCVYEVRDDAGGYDEFQDDETVAIYAAWEAAEEHAKQIGGYVRMVSESRQVYCETREDPVDPIWDWVNDDLFEGIAHLEKRAETGTLGLQDIGRELSNLEDMLEEGELDDTEDIRERIKILDYWYYNRLVDLLHP